MTFASRVQLDWAANTSTLFYSITPGIERSIFYEADGFLTLRPIVNPVVMALDDFESLVISIDTWLDLLGSQFKLPLASLPQIQGTEHSIGVQVGDTWYASSAVTFYGPFDGTMLFTHTPGVGVTLMPRPEVRLTFANLIYRNQEAYKLIAAARTGEWPGPDAPIPTPASTPAGPAGGVLAGAYPAPGFAQDMATQTELDAGLATRVPTTRQVASTAPLTGGGDLSTDRTLGVSPATTASSGVVTLATNGGATGVVQGTDGRLTDTRNPRLPFTLPTRTTVTSTTINPATDYAVAANTSAGALTITLPPTPANGNRYEISRIAGVGQLTIDRNGNPIDGGTTNPSVMLRHTVVVRFVSGRGWVTADAASA